jgi:flagellar motor protein MotB
MRSLYNRRSSSADEDNPYWMSFSDIMAALLVIFILATIIFMMELIQKSRKWDEVIEEIAKAEEVRKSIIKEIETELREKNIPVKVIDNDTVLRIPEHVLTFNSGSSELPMDIKTRTTAKEIGSTLYKAISKAERWKFLDTIFVEGHTDPDAYNNKMLKGNWGLSTMRAISLWQFWNDATPKGGKLDALINHRGKKLFSVSGYAATRRSCENACNKSESSKKAYEKDRRIDIRFTVRRPAIKEYKEVIKKVLK